jgi:hypothetical protein
LETSSQLTFINSDIVYYVGPGNKGPLNIKFSNNAAAAVLFDNCYLSNEAGQLDGDGYITERIEYKDVQFYNMPGKVTSNPRIYNNQNFYYRGGSYATVYLNYGTEWATVNPQTGGDLYQSRISKTPFVKYINAGTVHITVSGVTASFPSGYIDGKYNYLVGEVIKCYLHTGDIEYAQIGKISSIDNDGTVHLTKIIESLVSGSYALYVPQFSYMTVFNIGKIDIVSGINVVTNLIEEVSGATIDIGVGVQVFVNGRTYATLTSSAGTFTVDANFTESNDRALIQYCPTNFFESGECSESPDTAAGSQLVLFTKGSLYKNKGSASNGGWVCNKTGITNTAYPPSFTTY